MSRRKAEYFPRGESDPAPLTAEAHHIIQFSEVDPMGIAWHGHYPYFFQLAWTALSMKTGLTAEAFAARNTAVPIAQLRIDYRKPLFLNDDITIRASQIWSEGAKIQIEYGIFLSDGTCTATGSTLQLFFDVKTRFPLFLAPDILEEMYRRWKNGELA